MHMCLIASSVKITNKQNILPVTNRDGFMLRLIYMFLGCDLPTELLLKLLSSAYDERLIDHFHHVLIHIMNYEINNINFYA